MQVNTVSIAKAMLSNWVIPMLGPSHFSSHVDPFGHRLSVLEHGAGLARANSPEAYSKMF